MGDERITRRSRFGDQTMLALLADRGIDLDHIHLGLADGSEVDACGCGRDGDATEDRGWGSCRDLAVLFAEAARSLGFDARLVSGYLFNSSESITGSSGPGSTHAWKEVYVPGAGWITLGPTNQSVDGLNLILVAVTRDIMQIMPIAGSFVGMTDAFSGMSAEVSVLV